MRSIWTSCRGTHFNWLHLNLGSVVRIFQTCLRDWTCPHCVFSNYPCLGILTDGKVKWRRPKCWHGDGAECVLERMLSWTIAQSLLFQETSVLYLQKHVVFGDCVVVVKRTSPWNNNVDAGDWCWWSRRCIWYLSSLERNWRWVGSTCSIYVYCHNLITISLASQKCNMRILVCSKCRLSQSRELTSINIELNHVALN